MSDSTPPLIEARGLAMDFGDVPVFRSVSLALRAGGRMAVLGPSGCGKSTLLRLLTGLDAPGAGEILIRGALASEAGRVLLPPHLRGMGMVFQELALWPNLTALENVVLGMPRGAGRSRSQRRAAAREALDDCRLGALGHRKPAELSVGQQQRVALARALAPRPELLLLDEPFTGLDRALKAEIFDEIRRLAGESGLALLLVTHDPEEARALAEDALVFENGGARAQGPIEEVLASGI